MDNGHFEIVPEQLPIAEAREKLVKELKANPTLIVIGETGCGKTTQVPKYILQSGIRRNKLIAITQPRRMAAVSLGRRVAEELGEEVGETVGYSVRFDEKVSDNTVIKFMTDGMLLREGLRDPKFDRYSYIILDEAHERTINTDLLLGLVRDAQTRRSSGKKKKRLNIVVMSATMDVDKFHHHFESSKVVYIEGRQHNVKLLQALTPQDDYCFSTVALILKLHSELPSHHNILAFLTGQDEIESVVSILKKFTCNDEAGSLEVYPLYAALSHEEQTKVLSPTDRSTRRIVISTNIAETSLTIPGIKVVIDCGYVKAKFHEYGMSIDTLGVIKISKAQAMQRTGRAGRESNGVCYRLYTKEFFAELEENTVPEIKRAQISRCMLHLLQIGIENPFSFGWIDPPSDTATVAALKELSELEAIKVVGNKELSSSMSGNVKTRITELGSQMVSIPLEPAFSVILLKSSGYGIVEATACILAVLCSENIFRGQDEKTYRSKLKFSEPEGDLIVYLKIFREFRKCKSKFDWCRLNSLNYRALSFALKVRDHLFELCEEKGLDTRKQISWEETKESIRRCFHQCLKDNIAVLNQGKGNDYVVIRRGRLPVKIHPTSSLHNKGCPTVLFTEMTKVASGTNYIKHVTAINTKWT